MSALPEARESGSDIAALAHALARTVARQAARGHRRVAVLPSQPPTAAPAADLAADLAAGPAPGPSHAPQPQGAPEPSSAATSTPPQAARPQQAAPQPQEPATSGDPEAPPPRAVPDFKESTRPKRPDLAVSGKAPDQSAGPLKGPHPREAASQIQSLEALGQAVAACEACSLCETRTQTVFMDGPLTGRSKSRILFIGEAPGADEDRLGTPFVGRAGALLTDIITKGMGLAREDVSIANVLKCRPPGNRDPLPGETELCTGWLDRQIALIDPLVIVPLGRHAACHILGQSAPLGRLRARVHEVNGRKVVPTYHPAYLLRAPHEKKKAWEDIQLAMAEAGVPLPGR